MLPRNGIALTIWAAGTGLALWVPAWAVPGLPLPLQVMDLWVILGIPIGVGSLGRLGPQAGWIGASFLASIGLSTLTNGAEPLILGHSLVFALGFLLVIATVAASAPARLAFVRFFLIGSGFSAGLFLLQYLFGAQLFDLRTNLAFSLPEQFGRGFGLFPEVSTFSTHSGMAFAMAVTLFLLPGTPGKARLGLGGLIGLLLIVLMLSRSTSMLLVTPILFLLAVVLTRKPDPTAILRLGVATAILSGILAIYFTQFYADRLETASATRSAAMRLASILGGLSPLWSGELFGVGLGNNHEITRRAYDIGRAFDLSFGQLPQGVNSQIIARVFEEGWPAVAHFAVAATLTLRALRLPGKDAATSALCLLAVGSLLGALMVTGYRGIYTNWLWLALPAGLLAGGATRRSDPGSA